MSYRPFIWGFECNGFKSIDIELIAQLIKYSLCFCSRIHAERCVPWKMWLHDEWIPQALLHLQEGNRRKRYHVLQVIFYIFICFHKIVHVLHWFSRFFEHGNWFIFEVFAGIARFVVMIVAIKRWRRTHKKIWRIVRKRGRSWEPVRTNHHRRTRMSAFLQMMRDCGVFVGFSTCYGVEWWIRVNYV